MARGEYVVLLNNDTEPTAYWLDEMIHAFETFERVGLVGSKLLYPDGRLQEAGGIVWGDGVPWNYGRSDNPADPRFSYTRQADYLSGAAVMLPRVLWERLGGLSDEFRPAYYEDTDLAFRVREAGYRTVYAPLSVVFHAEGVSSGTSTASGMKRFQEVNRPKFERKWRDAYRGHGTDTARVDIEKDRGVAFRVLFIDAETPRPHVDAASHVAVGDMRAMQALGAKVTFVPEDVVWLGSCTTDLQRAGIEAIHAPFALSVEEFLRARGPEFDLIHISRYAVAQRHLESVRRHAPQAKVLFRDADLQTLRTLREAIAVGGTGTPRTALAACDAEQPMMRHLDVVIPSASAEPAAVPTGAPDAPKVVAVPWILDVARAVPGFEARSGIAVLGSLGTPLDAEAAGHVLRDVIPLLRRRLPGAHFLVRSRHVAVGPEALVDEELAPKDDFEDLAALFGICRIFVAPALPVTAATAEAAIGLAHGVPGVMSALTAGRIGLDAGGDALVARSPAEWVEAVAALYTDAERWQEVSQRALAFARRTFAFERGVERMRAATEAAGICPAGGMTPRRTRLGM
jgi:glycosyltransferase involved in cell wall biosynthesis